MDDELPGLLISHLSSNSAETRSIAAEAAAAASDQPEALLAIIKPEQMQDILRALFRKIGDPVEQTSIVALRALVNISAVDHDLAYKTFVKIHAASRVTTAIMEPRENREELSLKLQLLANLTRKPELRTEFSRGSEACAISWVFIGIIRSTEPSNANFDPRILDSALAIFENLATEPQLLKSVVSHVELSALVAIVGELLKGFRHRPLQCLNCLRLFRNLSLSQELHEVILATGAHFIPNSVLPVYPPVGSDLRKFKAPPLREGQFVFLDREDLPDPTTLDKMTDEEFEDTQSKLHRTINEWSFGITEDAELRQIILDILRALASSTDGPDCLKSAGILEVLRCWGLHEKIASYRDQIVDIIGIITTLREGKGANASALPNLSKNKKHFG